MGSAGSRAAAALALVTLLLVAAPANSWWVQVTDWDDSPVEPEIESRTMTLTLSATCEETFQWSTAWVYTTTPPVEITFDPAPGYVVSGPGLVGFQMVPCIPGTVIEQDTRFQVAMTRDVAALTPVEIPVSATRVRGLEPLDSFAQTTSTTFNATAAPYLRMTALAEPAILAVQPGGTATFPIAIANQGNTPITVTARLDSQPEWGPTEVAIPTVTVPRDETVGTSITIRAPEKGGWNNDQGLYRFAFEQTAVDGTAGHVAWVDLVLRVRGFGENAAPGPGAPLAVIALLAVALLARRA